MPAWSAPFSRLGFRRRWKESSLHMTFKFSDLMQHIPSRHRSSTHPLEMPQLHRRLRSNPPRSNRRLWLLLCVASSLLLLLSSLHACAAVLWRANGLGRRCLAEEPTHYPSHKSERSPSKIAIISFSDDRSAAGGVGRRSFEGLMEAVAGNKRAYAMEMGYDFIDAREAIDRSRPPSWSKILAVRSNLPYYDWVFWNDADTVVTNPDISLENILQSVIRHADHRTSPDLIVTEDINGINAGVFFVRRSAWSAQFLDTWWNQTSFVQFGSTKSGDNAALKYLIDSLPSAEYRKHVRVSPMQCLFNSYPWVPTWKSLVRLIASPTAVWKGVYSDGDFMVHLAGLDDKKGWTARILREMESVGLASV